ncbi:sensor histidine kinase [Lacticaseibacillus porcinae]|uniref:sensor histidine kinase n=1 Tax=Lacticaseibacillus porcinae TaxID=1123687 RepID=UPI000F7AD82F|nr:HAMP domain-containing sensor histidine kinase [Lacticaseibacillus porcinae]
MPKPTESSATRISRAYAWLLTVLMLAVGLATVSVVGAHLVRNKQEDAAQLMTTLQNSFADNKPDWDYWRDTANVNMRTSFVRVIVKPKTKTARYYYTKHTQAFLKDNWDTWALWSHVQYQKKHGIYYHLAETKHYGTTKVTYELWLSLNNMIELFKLTLLVIVVMSVIGLLLGIWLIHIFARRLNQPLVDLTTAAETIVETKDATYHETLPVPAGPAEVQALGVEFNRLLASLNQQVIRDHQFVSDASHELRTPLAAIRGHVGLIRRHAKDHPEIVPESLATIEASSLAMQELIERLLSLSRMDHAHLAGDWFDLSKLANRVAAAYPVGDHQPLQVITDNSVLAYAHRDSIEQVVVALLNNAEKYGENSQITIQVSRTADGAELSVSDQGPGVSDADKDKVFDRFYRVDASREKQIGGTGLGLAIAKRLIDLNHSELKVVDNHPTGARFVITLPTND